jgi:hypothetical protein
MKKIPLILVALTVFALAEESDSLFVRDEVPDTATQATDVVVSDKQDDATASAEITRENLRLVTPQATARWDRAYDNQVKYGTILYNSEYIDPAGIVAVGGVIPGGSSFFTHNNSGGVLHAIIQVGTPIIFSIVINSLTDATKKEIKDAEKAKKENITNAGKPDYEPKKVPKVNDRKGAKGFCIAAAIAIPLISKVVDMATGYEAAVKHNRGMETNIGKRQGETSKPDKISKFQLRKTENKEAEE